MTAGTAVVTGATSGIGRETAKGLARRGLSVVLVGRDRSRGEEALAEVRAEGGGAASAFVLADLSSIADARRGVAEIARRLPRLDVLVNNAGAIFASRRTSADGLEMTFALNHVGAFVVTAGLLPSLKAAGRARIVVVSSAAHHGAALDFDDLQSERAYSPWRAYQRSKLANVLFTRELARRLAGSGVTANSLHPGFVASRFGGDNGALWTAAFRLGQLFAISSAKSAEAVLRLALSPDLDGVTGAYLDRTRRRHPSRAAQDDAAARRLWEATQRLTGVAA